MKNIVYLLTGAAGFLGTSVCRQLLERGDKVCAFVLTGDKSVKYIPKEVELCESDLCNPADVNRFFKISAGMKSIVIHCASMVTVNPDFDQKLIDVNVGGTQNIIAACLNHSECKKLVYVSSTGAIPEMPKGQKIKEVNQFDPDKVVGSQEMLDAVRQHGLDACIVHPSGILGPNDYAVGAISVTFGISPMAALWLPTRDATESAIFSAMRRLH